MSRAPAGEPEDRAPTPERNIAPHLEAALTAQDAGVDPKGAVADPAGLQGGAAASTAAASSTEPPVPVRVGDGDRALVAVLKKSEWPSDDLRLTQYSYKFSEAGIAELYYNITPDEVPRRTGSPRGASNRRRRTRKGPDPRLWG